MLQRPHILLIDDTSADLQLMQMVIGMVDPELRVATAPNGEEALARLRKSSANALPGVILMDLRMYGKSGLEILEEMKSDPILKKIPVCIFSNGDFSADVVKAYELGASIYLRKPDGLDELKAFFSHFKALWFGFACLPG